MDKPFAYTERKTNKMKKLLIILLFFPLASFGQAYSNYYGTLNVNQNVNANVNVNKNVDVSGNVNVNKTVTSIDYGALRLANAQMEKNRLEQQMYANQEQKRQAIEIATNPMRAYDYGYDNSWYMDKKIAESYGWKKKTIYYHKVPNNSLFSNMGEYKYRNESENGVITEIELKTPTSLFTTTFYYDLKKKEKEKMKENWSPVISDFEKFVKKKYMTGSKDFVGKVDEQGNYTHKFEVKKAKVFGIDGFIITNIYENDFEYVIKDNYEFALPNGVVLQGAGVRYRGDKNEVTFEDLEGRRHYFRRLVNQIFATASITDPKGKGDIFNK